MIRANGAPSGPKGSKSRGWITSFDKEPFPRRPNSFIRHGRDTPRSMGESLRFSLPGTIISKAIPKEREVNRRRSLDFA